jgi:hypothetical protein
VRIVAVVFIGMVLSAAEPSMSIPTGAEFSRWKAHIEKMQTDPTLVSFHQFDEGRGQLSRNTKDVAPFSEMLISGNDWFSNRSPQDFPKWVAGRWRGKSALCIGTGLKSIQRTHFHGVDGIDFSVGLWIRPHALVDEKSRAVFASVGDAWSSGWRLEADKSGVGFILGRTLGVGEGKGIVVARSSKTLSANVWHNLVGVVSGKKLQVYADGILEAEKDFDGVYKHVKTPSVRYSNPELDYDGLQLGTTQSQASNTRFDIDELAIYSRPLGADQIASDYNAGKPLMAEEEHSRMQQEALKRQAQLAGITITLPTDTFGYLPIDSPIVVALDISGEAAALFDGKAVVSYGVKKFQGETVSSVVKELPLTSAAHARWEQPLQPNQCGLYELAVAVNRKSGNAVKSVVIPFAVRLPLPNRKDIPGSSMLAGYDCIKDETPTFGTKVERIIQPIYGRAKDGGPNYAESDAFVEQCGSMGLDVLYCIGIGFWDAGKYRTLAEWQRNPTFHQEHLRNLVSRYKGRVKYWEILNEPNSGHLQGMTAKIYVKFLKESYDIIKSVDPKAQVVGPCGTSSYQEWTEDVLAAGGGAYLDILSFHNYIGASPIENSLKVGRVAAVKASMRKHVGKLLPMWNSECGLHQPARIDGRQATDAELLKLYGGRASRADAVVTVGVDAILMVNEHRSACWQVQSVLMEMVDGVEKFFMLMRPSQPYPSDTQMLTEKGVALAAMQSVITSATSTRFIPTGLLGTVCVAVNDSKGSTTAVLFSDSRVSQVIRIADKAGVVVKGMDYLGNPLEMTTGEGGLVRVTLDVEPLYVFRIPEFFSMGDCVRFDSAPSILEPLTGVDVWAEVSNPYDTQSVMSLRAEVSCGLATPEKEFTLGPKEKRKVRVGWATGEMWKGDHWLRLSVNAKGALVTTRQIGGYKSNGKLLGVPALSGAFPLDGDAGKWATVPEQVANTAARAVIGSPVEGAMNPAFWRNQDDLSFTYKNGWTKDGIHFLITVRDDVRRPPMNEKEEKEAFLFDGVELFLDCRPSGGRGDIYLPGAAHFLIVPSLGSAVAPCPVLSMGKPPPPATITCVGKLVDGGYLIEGIIKPMDGSMLRILYGTEFNLDVSVDDNDDKPGQLEGTFGRRVQMALHGTAANSNNTSAWGRYKLTK